MTLCHSILFDTFFCSKKYYCEKSMTKIQIKPNKRGRPPKHYTYNQINHAIQTTDSMKMASEYLNMSYNNFKKWAKQYDLFNPLPTSAGIRRRNSVKISPHNLQKILEGENPSPYRETVLLKKCFQEGYLKQECSSCGTDFSYIENNLWPLVLDFFDKNHNNTKLENLRVLCLNCVYTLQTTQKGWYRHREIPLNDVVDNRLPRDIHIEKREPTIINTSQDNAVPIVDNEQSVDFIPFEEFQKTLEN